MEIRSFTDLKVWQEAHSLALSIYSLTKNFPSEEKFGLVNQIRRAAVSVSSNIAEGFSRQSIKEKIQFYSVSQGSLTELQNQLLIARDLNFLSIDNFKVLADKGILVNKLLSGLIRSSKLRLS